ncbi:MAG: methanogen output domain 1-containing protein [Candidatus Helarchaeota archaeon]
MSQQLKFIASLFKMIIEESLNVMGPETVQTLFRLIGERQGERVEKRLKTQFKIDKWTPEDFAIKFIKEVIEPALGEGQAEYNKENDDIIINIKICPFQQANIDVSGKLYCTYTQGLVEQAFTKAIGKITFKTEQLIAENKPNCIFRISLQ